MKARTVIVTLEIGTELSLRAMCAPAVWTSPQVVARTWDVEGVTARVAQPVRPKASKRKPAKPAKAAKAKRRPKPHRKS